MFASSERCCSTWAWVAQLNKRCCKGGPSKFVFLSSMYKADYRMAPSVHNGAHSTFLWCSVFWHLQRRNKINPITFPQTEWLLILDWGVGNRLPWRFDTPTERRFRVALHGGVRAVRKTYRSEVRTGSIGRLTEPLRQAQVWPAGLHFCGEYLRD